MRDHDDPRAVDQLVLVVPQDFAETAARAIARDRATHATRGDEAGAQFSVGGDQEHAQRKELPARQLAFSAHALKLCRAGEPAASGKAKRARHAHILLFQGQETRMRARRTEPRKLNPTSIAQTLLGFDSQMYAMVRAVPAKPIPAAAASRKA
jgi:hypothetical protein